ncbi:ion channel [Fulvivirga lutimaris]|uniref:ion channel n=1 Tax=Fulvivirga lutimaris TaxID=1819566 RepID=UPI0012BBB4CB|nr:ion channel [Fulvivirga lutimaris]MTI38639.1 hypothetical protein [Fulvivirga lutimaris]
MAKRKVTQDPGTGTAYNYNSKRVINKNGSFNVIKRGLGWSYRNTYQALIKMSWSRFFLIIFSYLFAINACFGLLIALIGVDGLSGITPVNFVKDFLHAYYFSFQTFTTVGYGAIAPQSDILHVIAIIDAIAGWLSFALITGILYGRFSKPSARLWFSEKALVAPYRDGINSLQFRIANMRKSTLIEMEASLILMTIGQKDGKPIRQFTPLDLERERILFFPLNWTIVHPIDDKSPLHGKGKEDFAKMQTELLILIKGFDDTFSQTVHARYSYTFDEIVWGAKFVSAYSTGESGDEVIDFDKMDVYEDRELL